MYDREKGFTLVMSNDPDHGRSEDYRKIFAGLDRLGVKITTAVFCTIEDDGSGLARHCHKGETDSLADPEYRDLMLEADANGHEIAYHGYSQVSNTRETFLEGLDIFEQTFGHPPKTFIKHGGHLGLHEPSMCKKEDLSYEGTLPGSPYHVADIIEQRFKWVWELHRLFDPKAGQPDPQIRYGNTIVYPRCENFGFWRHRLGHLDWPDNTFAERLTEAGGVYMGYTHFGYAGYAGEILLEHWLGEDLEKTFARLAEIIEKHNVTTLTMNQFCSRAVKEYGMKTFSESRPG